MVSPASAGPRVSQAPAAIAFSSPNAATTTQSQVVPRNSRQPSRSSVSVDVAVVAGVAGMPGTSASARRAACRRTGRRSTAATSQVAASASTAHPDPTVTTSRVPRLGPAIVVRPRDALSRALAGWSWSRGTSVGTMAAIAGKPTPDAPPATACSTRSSHSSAVPVSSSTAVAPWAAALVRFEACSTNERGRRSARTPPKSSTTIIGTVRAASTCPSVVADPPRSSTAKAIATEAAVTPRKVTVRDARYQANAGWRSGPREAGRLTARP